MDNQLIKQIADLTALNEPTRRALYFFVVDSGGEASRDQAARALGVSRNLAGFHLDRLAEDGLLHVSYRRLSGRSGPGAGRPSKLYRRSEHQIQVSLPQRDYELAAQILAATVNAHTPTLAATLDATARGAGQRIGRQTRAGVPPQANDDDVIEAIVAALSAHGYEPIQQPGEVQLRNCPFHRLMKQNKELVCGMNLSMIEGLVEGAGLVGARPVLDPQGNRCCVCLKLAADCGQVARNRREAL